MYHKVGSESPPAQRVSIHLDQGIHTIRYKPNKQPEVAKAKIYIGKNLANHNKYKKRIKEQTVQGWDGRIEISHSNRNTSTDVRQLKNQTLEHDEVLQHSRRVSSAEVSQADAYMGEIQ